MPCAGSASMHQVMCVLESSVIFRVFLSHAIVVIRKRFLSPPTLCPNNFSAIHHHLGLPSLMTKPWNSLIESSLATKNFPWFCSVTVSTTFDDCSGRLPLCVSFSTEEEESKWNPLSKCIPSFLGRFLRPFGRPTTMMHGGKLKYKVVYDGPFAKCRLLDLLQSSG